MEPGPTLAGSFLAVANRVWVFRSLTSMNDSTAPAAATIPAQLVPSGTIRVGDDELTEYRRPMIDAATDRPYAVSASADLVLASSTPS